MIIPETLFGMPEACWILTIVGILLLVLFTMGTIKLVSCETARHGLAKVLSFTVVCMWMGYIAADKPARSGGDPHSPSGEYCEAGSQSSGEPPPRSGASTRLPDACDVGESEGFGAMPIATNLMSTAIAHGSNSTYVVFSWPFGQRPVDDIVYVYAGTNLLELAKVFSVDVSGCASNALVVVEDSDFAGTNACQSAFVSAGDATDTDGDGLSDTDERFVYKTDPASSDTDGDGLSDGEEIAMGSSPIAADTDGDGLEDGEELGYATILPSDEFLWLNASNGVAGVSHYKNVSSQFGHVWLTDEYSMMIQGRDCNELFSFVDGFVVISLDSEDLEPLYMHWNEDYDLRYDARSGGAVVVAGLNYDMALMPGRCMAVVETNGASYAVYRAESQVANNAGPSGTCAVTYEVIIPFGEPDTVYVSYLDVGDSIAALDMDLGVQCPSMRSVLDTNELYTVLAPPGALRSRTTVKYVLGRNTDPRLLDTDGDGIPDGFPRVSEFDADGDGLADSLDPEPTVYGGDFHGQSTAWVTASFTNAEEIIQEGYENWVARIGSLASSNGIYELSVVVPQSAGHATLVCVGDFQVVAEPGADLRFPVEKNDDVTVSFYPRLEANPQFAACGNQDGHLGVAGTVEWLEYVVRFEPDLVVNPSKLYITGGSANGPTALSAFVDLPVPVSYSWRDVAGIATFMNAGLPSTYALGVTKDSQLEVEATAAGGYVATGRVVIVAYDYLSQGMVGASCPSVVFLNDDSDNNNVIPDRQEQRLSVDDDELVPVSFRYEGDNPAVETLRLSAVSGSAKVRFWSDMRKTSRVQLPAVFPTNGGTLYMEGYSLSSSEGDVELKVAARSGNGNEISSVEFPVTVCRPVAEPICSAKHTEEEDWWVVNPASVVIGERAFFRVSDASGAIPASRVTWTVSGSGAHIVGSSTGWEIEVAATAAADEIHVVAHFGDCPSPPPEFVVNSLAMRTVKVYPYILRNLYTGVTACSEEFVSRRIDWANKLYRQVGIQVVLGQTIAYADVDHINVHNFDKKREKELWQKVLDCHNDKTEQIGSDGVELYFCGDIEWIDINGSHLKPIGLTTQYGTFISKSSPIETLAHELGHSLGQADLYSEIKIESLNTVARLSCNIDNQMLVDSRDRGRPGRALWAYSPGATAADIVGKCLMLGQEYPGVERVDISSGGIMSFYSIFCFTQEEAESGVGVRQVGRTVIDTTYNTKINQGFWNY